MLTGGTGCGTRSDFVETGAVGPAGGAGDPLFSGGGADGDANSRRLRALCAGIGERSRRRRVRRRRAGGNGAGGAGVSGFCSGSAPCGHCRADPDGSHRLSGQQLSRHAEGVGGHGGHPLGDGGRHLRRPVPRTAGAAAGVHRGGGADGGLCVAVPPRALAGADRAGGHGVSGGGAAAGADGTGSAGSFTGAAGTVRPAGLRGL